MSVQEKARLWPSDFPAGLRITGTVRKKLFRSFLLCCLVPTILVGFVGSGLIAAWQHRQSLTNGEATLEKVENAFLETVEGFDQLACDLSFLNWVQKMMQRQTSFDRYEMGTFAKDLSVYRNSNELLSFVGIYFLEKEVAVTSNGLMDLAFFDGEAVLIDGVPPTSWLAEHPLKNQQSAIYPLPIQIYAQQSDGLLYVKPMSLSLGETEPRAVLFFFSPRDDLNHSINRLLPEGSDACLFDGEDGLYFSACSRTPDFYEPVLAQKASSFSWENYYVQTRVLEGTDLSLSLFTAKDAFYSGMAAIAALSLSFLTVAVVFGVLLAYELSQSNYRPLGNLVSFLQKGAVGQKEGGDEYLYLQSVIANMLEQNKAYSQKLVFTSEQVLTANLLKLLNDIPVSPEGLEEIAAHFPKPCTCCVSIQERMLSGELSGELIDRFEQSLHRFSLDFFQISSQANEYLLNFERPEQLDKLVASLLKNQEAFSAVFFSFGGICVHIDQLGRSYKEMQSAGKYRRLHIGSCVSLYQDTVKSDFYYYPISDEFQLASHIHTGDEPKALVLLEQLYRYNLDLEAASRHGIRNFFCDLILSLVKIAQEYELPLPATLERYLEAGNASPEQLFKEVSGFIGLLCAYSLQTRRPLSGAKQRQLFDFVNSHICSPDLSLQYLADHFHISVSYASQLFKEETGDSFVDYCNFHRIEQAKKLLVETGLDIASISQACGFLNDSTCRRLFKKYTGCSPSQYRRENQR